jgi:hypothetical protein
MYTTQTKKRFKQQNKAFRNKDEYMQKEQKNKKLQMKHDKRTLLAHTYTSSRTK